nr:reverse transcriptase domain-containing protein [Tanacetum cinerariifolium]
MAGSVERGGPKGTDDREETPPLLTKEQIEGHVSALKSLIKSQNQRNKGDPIRLDFESEDTEVQDLGIAKGKEVMDEDLGKPFKEARRTALTRRIIERMAHARMVPNVSTNPGRVSTRMVRAASSRQHKRMGGLKRCIRCQMDGGNGFYYGCPGGHEGWTISFDPRKHTQELSFRKGKWEKPIVKRPFHSTKGTTGYPETPTWENHEGTSTEAITEVEETVSSILTLESLTKRPKEILATETQLHLPPPHPMLNLLRSRNTDRYYDYHQEKGHYTNDCIQLRKQLEMALESGKLNHLCKFDKRQKAEGGEITEPWINILISFPVISSEDIFEEPLIVEADVKGYLVRMVYVDEGSSVEVMFEHCFENLEPRIKAKLKETQTDLVGFAGEISKPLGKIEL